MELVNVHLLLAWLLVQVLLAFEFEASFTDDGSILGLKVPDLPSDLSADSNPMTPGVESEAVDGGSSIELQIELLDITEIEDSDLLVLATSYNKVAPRRDSDGIDVGIMHRHTVLNIEGLVVPDLEITVPSD